MYNNRRFSTTSNTPNGEVGGDTVFDYHQAGTIVWATYSGGSIEFGTLIATVGEDNSLNMRYQHVNRGGQIMTGICHSIPEILPDGRLRLYESWQWTSGDFSFGHSIVEEIAMSSSCCKSGPASNGDGLIHQH